MKNASISVRLGNHIRRHWQKHLMMIPCLGILILFNYVPMVGIVMGFQNYSPSKGFFGSPWVGLDWFKFMFNMSNFSSVIWNTLFISILKIVSLQLASVIFALMLHEMKMPRTRSLVQGAAIFPNFLSWVVCAGIITDVVAQDGMLNQIIHAVSGTNISFLTNPSWFIVLLVITNVWKDAGYNAVIIMAALAGIDPNLYEAADIDGATRMQKMRYVTLPGISQIVAMLTILALGGVMSGGFDQIWNMYNATVRSSSEIIDTYVYRMGVNSGMYSLGTAVGLFKSAVGAVLLLLSHWAAKKYAGYQIF
ncbi:MAG: sugar ABC transporter permease [Clostridia bacterium]|nr:sugar ABC transporter permease [Clostridia bacterium]